MLLTEARRILKKNGYVIYLNEDDAQNNQNGDQNGNNNQQNGQQQIDETKFKWDMRITFGKDESSAAKVWLLADPKSTTEKNDKNLMGTRLWMIMEAQGDDTLVKAKQCLCNCASLQCIAKAPFALNIMKGGKTVANWKSPAPIIAIDNQETAKKKAEEAAKNNGGNQNGNNNGGNQQV